MPSQSKGLPAKAAKLRAGFTLTELLIVVALIAILAVAGLIGYRLQLSKSHDAIRKRDLNNIKIAFEHYFSDNGCYPPASILNNCGGAQLQPYLDKIPCDPETGAPYSLTLDTTTGCAQKFYAYTDLSNKNDTQIRCNGKYMVNSSNMTDSELNAGCTGQIFCQSGYYGCIAGSCVLISAITKPACSPMFCSINCQNSCSNPSFELTPQPCNP